MESKKTPNQGLYDALFILSESLNYQTYAFLPKQGAPYPFVVIQDISDAPDLGKVHSIGMLEARIDIFGSGENRLQVSTMAQNLFNLGWILDEGRYRMMRNQSNIQILQDQTTDENLWRSILTLRYRYAQ